LGLVKDEIGNRLVNYPGLPDGFLKQIKNHGDLMEVSDAPRIAGAIF